MKWMLLLGICLLCSGCGCCYNRAALVEYKQVAVAPVVEPVSYSYCEPIDVTTTTIDFY